MKSSLYDKKLFTGLDVMTAAKTGNVLMVLHRKVPNVGYKLVHKKYKLFSHRPTINIERIERKMVEIINFEASKLFMTTSIYLKRCITHSTICMIKEIVKNIEYRGFRLDEFLQILRMEIMPIHVHSRQKYRLHLIMSQFVGWLMGRNQNLE